MLYSKTLGQGPNLVFLHGWGMNTAVWEDTIAPLASDFCITLIDLPGHGYSPWAGTERNLGEWADACLETAPDTALWIGWSLGGAVALAAALAAPQRIRALMMVTTTPCFLRGANWPYGLQPGTLARFRDTLNADWITTLGHFLTLQVRGSDHALLVLRTLRRQLAERPAPNPQALEMGLELLKDTDLTESMFRLKIPSLWLYGERDSLVPWRCSESLLRLLPTAQVEIIKGAAHAPFISHREHALELLRRFAV